MLFSVSVCFHAEALSNNSTRKAAHSLHYPIDGYHSNRITLARIARLWHQLHEMQASPSCREEEAREGGGGVLGGVGGGCSHRKKAKRTNFGGLQASALFTSKISGSRGCQPEIQFRGVEGGGGGGMLRWGSTKPLTVSAGTETRRAPNRPESVGESLKQRTNDLTVPWASAGTAAQRRAVN